LKIGFNGTSGLVQWIEQNGTRHQLQQNFYFYESMKGYNFNADNRASGAYIFRPTKNQPTVISEKINLTIYRGMIKFVNTDIVLYLIRPKAAKLNTRV